MINPEANVNLKNSNNDNKIINESLIDKRKIKKNEKKQIIDIKDLPSEQKKMFRMQELRKIILKKKYFFLIKFNMQSQKI